ncbi:tRNA ribose methylase TRM3p [Cryptosporidium ubiquitum]|uniref:tRNA ribose methylase TRM3p n=1 Tax=Cryptosporidium ubiquitum TaxID=857276 RepID=A0A1J4MP14_9CRYT|nr:tRNA ribose methylase TRM3p [Cryptosporidium ubiquitum]OII74613.1 tRNA ribose methylase TRM3p [Cryptosporidium ubiquitum]
MKEQIQQLVESLEKSGNNYNTLINTLDILLKIQYEKQINKSIQEFYDVTLRLVRETDCIKSQKKFLCYICILKFISKHMSFSLKELILEDCLINFYKIKCNIIKDQIHEIVFNVTCSNLSEFYIIMDIWRNFFTKINGDKNEFESLTELILYVCYHMQYRSELNHQLNEIIYKIIQNFSEIYESDSSIFLINSFVSKLEYSQNLFFPLFLDCNNFGEQTSRLIGNMMRFFESNINIKVFVFTLRIPNFIEHLVFNGFISHYREFTTSLIRGITSKDFEIRKSTRFILEKFETLLLENNLNTFDQIDKHKRLNNIKSFICILDCFENFSIHLLKTNWEKFEKLLYDLQNSRNEWWIDCLLEIGLNHENLNVRRFVAFNTINYVVRSDESLPSWIKRHTFFNIYLRYIVSVLNNKISLQIEELFLKFIYCILKVKSEWIGEYIDYIIYNIKAFTPIRVLIYPLRIGVNNLYLSDNSGSQTESNITKIKSYFCNAYSCNIKTNLRRDITQKYSFEDDKKFKESIIVPKELFKKVLDISIPIIKFVPILLRREVYSKWLEIILNYFICNEFSEEELITNFIFFLGIIPEYLFYTYEINKLIYNNIIKYKLVIDSSFDPESLIKISKRWFDVLHIGVGFGRLKKIFGSFSEINLIMKSHVIFVSSYYNYEEINHLNNEINNKILEILEKIKILFENIEENHSIDIDLLWLDIHLLSILKDNSYDFYLKKLWDWCILAISDIGRFLTKIKSNINSQISFAMILKCLIYLQNLGKKTSIQKIFDLVNNLLLINNGILSKMFMNNQNLIIWDRIRRVCFLYDIIDTHSLNNDNYCIIQSSLLTPGFPVSYSSKCNGIIKENRLIQLFPANYRDLLNLISQLKFQFINLIISKNNDKISSLVGNDVYSYFVNFKSSTDRFSYTKGSYLDWFTHITKILIYEIENSGCNSFYLWLLVEQLLSLVCTENNHQFEESFTCEFFNKIFLLIIKNCDELIDNGIYRNHLFRIFNSILTKKEYLILFEKYQLLEKVANHFYGNIKLNNGNIRLFIFPLLDFIKSYVESCNEEVFEEILKNSENIGLTQSKTFNNIFLFANILVELITFEEQGLIDGCKIRFQEFSKDNIGISEMINIYRRCKIYEDNSSFIRHVTIIYLSNMIENSIKNKKYLLIKFVSLTIILLTKKLEAAIPKSVENELFPTNTQVNKVDLNIPNNWLINETEISFKNAKKFPPLPNSNHHKLLINIWQSLCCLVNILNLSEDQFTNYLIGVYFKHLQYLYTPDVRQYIDMFGCNIVTFFPKKCIGHIIKGLSNNINNHTQVIYSYLCISSYLIHFLKDITPFPLKNGSEMEKISDVFILEGEIWIKLTSEFLDEYILFFNLFVSYSISNSSLLRNIVLFTLFDAYNNNYVFELVQKSFENNYYSDTEAIDSLANVLKNAFQIEDINTKADTIRNSIYYVNNKLNASKKIFLINLFILEDSKYIRTVLHNIFNNKDILKMLKYLSLAWTIWKPIKYCTVENIIPQDNIIEFSDQKESQNFFNCSSCLDFILSKLDGNIFIDEVSFEKELLAVQDKHETYILNSHLIFGDLRPSWSLYYLLKKIISEEMSGYYTQENNKEKEDSNAVEIQSSHNYQLKFEPLNYTNPISGEPRSKRQGHRSLDRTELIVIGSLVDKIPNIAGITRTCEIFRAKELLLSNKKVINDPIFKQISVTAEKWLPINELEPKKIKEYVHNKRIEGYKIFGLEQTSSSTNIKECIFPKKSVLILGKEKEGIPSDIVSIVDQCIEIPQYGIIRSLNVHVSASIFIYEYTTQFMEG